MNNILQIVNSSKMYWKQKCCMNFTSIKMVFQLFFLLISFYFYYSIFDLAAIFLLSDYKIKIFLQTLRGRWGLLTSSFWRKLANICGPPPQIVNLFVQWQYWRDTGRCACQLHNVAQITSSSVSKSNFLICGKFISITITW